MTDFIIRPAIVSDCPAILEMIQELADYEKMPNGPKLDLKTFQEDGFGKEPFYKCFVAEVGGREGEKKKVMGYVLYYYTYATWTGKSIYMEDLYVKPEYRGHGMGTQLWQEVIKIGLQAECSQLDFVVLDWNKPSIEYYKKRGAINLTENESWNLFRITQEKMKLFARC